MSNKRLSRRFSLPFRIALLVLSVHTGIVLVAVVLPYVATGTSPGKYVYWLEGLTDVACLLDFPPNLIAGFVLEGMGIQSDNLYFSGMAVNMLVLGGIMWWCIAYISVASARKLFLRGRRCDNYS